MSTYPRFEARVSALERRQINTDARVEELSEDTTTSIKHLSDDMTASFKQLTDYLIKTEEKTEERFNNIENRLDKIEATQKEHTTRLTNIETLLTQILERLPKNPN